MFFIFLYEVDIARVREHSCQGRRVFRGQRRRARCGVIGSPGMTGTIGNPFSYLAGELPGCGLDAGVRAGEIAAGGPDGCTGGLVAAWSTSAVIGAGKSAADSCAGCGVMTGSASGSSPGRLSMAPAALTVAQPLSSLLTTSASCRFACSCPVASGM